MTRRTITGYAKDVMFRSHVIAWMAGVVTGVLVEWSARGVI